MPSRAATVAPAPRRRAAAPSPLLKDEVTIKIAKALGITFDYQHELLLMKERYGIWDKARGIGWSSAEALRTVLKSLEKPRETILISRTEGQAKHIMEYVQVHWQRLLTLDLKLNITTKIKNMGLTYMRWDNGSAAYALSSNPAATRGYHGDAVVDEFAHFPRGQDKQLRIALNGVLTGGGSLHIGSTPYGLSGEFYRIWNDEGAGFRKFELPHTRRTDSEYQESVAMARREMLPMEFAQEFECQFVAEASQPIPKAIVDQNTQEYEINRIEDSDDPRCLGMDFARIRDCSVIVGIERVRERTWQITQLYEFEHMDFDEQENETVAIVERWKPWDFFVDKTSIGIPLEESLSKRLHGAVTGQHFTNQLKEKMYQLIKTHLMDGRLILPKHETLIDQLISLEKIVTPDGLVRYRHPYGKRDDYVWALGLALLAAQQHEDEKGLDMQVGAPSIYGAIREREVSGLDLLPRPF